MATCRARSVSPRPAVTYTGLRVFIVQTVANADWVGRYETREEAVAAVRELFAGGLAERGQFNVAELDAERRTIRVFGVDDEAAPLQTAAPV